MYIIVGLGNPGEKFTKTRHNAGFMAVDFFVKKNNLSEFKMQKKYDAMVSENDDIVLVKPQTFMNDSGRVAQSLLKNSDAPLIIVHDDIDIPLGKMKFSQGSSSGGHKGVESIIHLLGTKDFLRLKIGIATNDQEAKEVVLEKFTPPEQEIMDGVIKKSAEALQCLIESGLEKTMNEYNR